MVEGPEIPHHHHHKTGLPWFDLVVPVAVIFISVAALLTSLQSEKSMHALVDENKRLVSAQSTPMLMLDSSNLDDHNEPAISMTISNVGTGPARIAWFHLHDEQGNDDSGGTLYERMAKLDPGVSFESQQITGKYLRGGDQRLVFKWPKPKNGVVLAAWDKMNHDRFTLHASACYCSMFEECRVTEFGESQPRMVASCEQAK